MLIKQEHTKNWWNFILEFLHVSYEMNNMEDKFEGVKNFNKYVEMKDWDNMCMWKWFELWNHKEERSIIFRNVHRDSICLCSAGRFIDSKSASATFLIAQFLMGCRW